MNTEITDISAEYGWMLCDGHCALCLAPARRREPVPRRRGLALTPIQTPRVCERLGLDAPAPPAEMLVLPPHGKPLGGADAVVHLARWNRAFSGLAGRFVLRPVTRKCGIATAGPVFWLFHPPFVRNVILPMLDALGAT